MRRKEQLFEFPDTVFSLTGENEWAKGGLCWIGMGTAKELQLGIKLVLHRGVGAGRLRMHALD